MEKEDDIDRIARTDPSAFMAGMCHALLAALDDPAKLAIIMERCEKPLAVANAILSRSSGQWS